MKINTKLTENVLKGYGSILQTYNIAKRRSAETIMCC